MFNSDNRRVLVNFHQTFWASNLHPLDGFWTLWVGHGLLKKEPFIWIDPLKKGMIARSNHLALIIFLLIFVCKRLHNNWIIHKDRYIFGMYNGCDIFCISLQFNHKEGQVYQHTTAYTHFNVQNVYKGISAHPTFIVPFFVSASIQP